MPQSKSTLSNYKSLVLGSAKNHADQLRGEKWCPRIRSRQNWLPFKYLVGLRFSDDWEHKKEYQ